MTGSASDPPEWQQHVRSKRRRKELAGRFKDPNSDFRLVIVRDMWLTGFDAPCLHTMYLDKPMHLNDVPMIEVAEDWLQYFQCVNPIPDA